MTKLVLRVFDADGTMLGAAIHMALMPGDGTLRASSPVQVTADVAGVPVRVHAHWCDPNIGVDLPLPSEARPVLKVGDGISLYERNVVILKLGEVPVNLPPVIVRSRAIDLPVGVLGAAAI